MESYVIGYEPHKGVLAKHSKGALISTATGKKRIKKTFKNQFKIN